MSAKVDDISLGSVQHSLGVTNPEGTNTVDQAKKKLKLEKRAKVTKEDLNPKNIPERARHLIRQQPRLKGLGIAYVPAAFISVGGGKSAVEIRELNFRAGMGLHIGFLPLLRVITANAGLHIVYDVRSRPDFIEDKKAVRIAGGIQPSVTLSYLEVNFPILTRFSDPDYIGDPERTKGLGICAAMPLTYGLLSFCAESLNFFGQKAGQRNWTFSARLGW